MLLWSIQERIHQIHIWVAFNRLNSTSEHCWTMISVAVWIQQRRSTILDTIPFKLPCEWPVYSGIIIHESIASMSRVEWRRGWVVVCPRLYMASLLRSYQHHDNRWALGLLRMPRRIQFDCIVLLIPSRQASRTEKPSRRVHIAIRIPCLSRLLPGTSVTRQSFSSWIIIRHGCPP